MICGGENFARSFVAIVTSPLSSLCAILMKSPEYYFSRFFNFLSKLKLRKWVTSLPLARLVFPLLVLGLAFCTLHCLPSRLANRLFCKIIKLVSSVASLVHFFGASMRLRHRNVSIKCYCRRFNKPVKICVLMSP